MESTIKIFRKFVNVTLIAIIGIMVTVVFMQVVSRYVFNNPLRWSEEIARICLIWTTFLGAAVAVEKNLHFKVNGFVEKMPRKLSLVINVLISIIMIAYVLVIIWGSFFMVFNIRMSTTPALGIPVKAIYFALPLSGLLMIVNLLASIRTMIAKSGRG